MDDPDSDSMSSVANTFFGSNISLPAVLDNAHSGLSDIKLAEEIVHPSRKSSGDSSSSKSSSGKPDNKQDQGATKIYASQEVMGEGSGAGMGRAGVGGGVEGAGGAGAGGVPTAAVVAAVRRVERDVGAPAMVAGMPLIPLLEEDAMAQDAPEVPRIARPRQEDARTVPLPVTFNLPTIEELEEERTPPVHLGYIFPEEFQVELERIEGPAFKLGKQLRYKELHLEEKERAEALREQRQKIHDAHWEKHVELGKKAVDEERRARHAGPSKHRLAEATHHLAQQAHEGKEKVFPAVKKFLGKYGPSIAKAGVKVGVDLLENNVGGGIGN